MRSKGIVIDKEISKSFVEERLVMDEVEVVVNELFLEGAVVAFNESVNFRAAGVREEMRDAVSLKLGMELA